MAWIDQHQSPWLRWTAAAPTLAGLLYRVAGGRYWPRRLGWLMRPCDRPGTPGCRSPSSAWSFYVCRGSPSRARRENRRSVFEYL